MFPSLLANPTACDCNFSTLTFIDALQGGGGSTICDAQKILLRAAVAALLNACDGSVKYPLSTATILNDVNAALASCNRTTTLNEATTLDNLNNGLGGCPLGGPATKGLTFRN